MGRVSCEKHGQQGFVEMCSHLHDSFQNNQCPEHRFHASLNIMLCPTCWKELKADRLPEVDLEDLDFLESEGGKKADKIFFEIYDQIPGRKVMCLKCVEEIKGQTSTI